MKIRTLEQLSDRLSQEIAWRKKELALLRGMIESETPGTDRQTALLRGGITVLYAHWEGFVKAAATAYLEFVAMQGHSYEELTANFPALAMKAKLDLAQQTQKAVVFNRVAEFILAGLAEKCVIQYKDAVHTKSNLTSRTFRDIVAIVNIAYADYATKEKLIDEKLVRTRNSVAHGKHLLVDLAEYRELHEEVVAMMELFRNQLENAACTRAYLRCTASTRTA